MTYARIATLVMVLLAGLTAPAQETDAPAEQPVTALRPLDRPTWRRLIEPLRYYEDTGLQEARERRTTSSSEDDAEEEESAAKRSWWPPAWLSAPWLAALSQGLLILGAAALLFFLFKALIGAEGMRKKARTKPPLPTEPAEIDLDLLVEEPQALDDPDRIARAEAEGDYALAFRLQYLRLLHRLAEAGTIEARRGKSNREYVDELRHTPFHEPVARLNRRFERVVYGEFGLPASVYATLRQTFSHLLDHLAGRNSPKSQRP